VRAQAAFLVVGAEVAKEEKARTLRRTLGMRKAAALDGRKLRTVDGYWSVLHAGRSLFFQIDPSLLKRYMGGPPDTSTCPTLAVRPLFAFYRARF